MFTKFEIWWEISRCSLTMVVGILFLLNIEITTIKPNVEHLEINPSEFFKLFTDTVFFLVPAEWVYPFVFAWGLLIWSWIIINIILFLVKKLKRVKE